MVDVDSDIELQRMYGQEIPVVEVGPYKLKSPFTRQDLEITLSAAWDRLRQIEKLDDPNYIPQTSLGMTWSNSDRFSLWISNHYLAVLNVLVFIYFSLPVLAPILMKTGALAPANTIYRAYSLVCHQLAFRSFFLFGEQPVYPRQIAGLSSIMSLSQATGLSEESTAAALYQARQFVGNQVVGFKVALCERDLAIYGSIFLFGIIFGLTGRKIKPLPWYIWILVGVLPIALDGLSQLLSQPPFGFFPLRESTPFLRVLTGFLFGFTTAWFGYPLVEQSMSETRQMMLAKKSRIEGVKFGEAKSAG
jgi:uncharacterized membrane protein